LKRFETEEKTIENKDGKWCILTVFGTFWNCRENFEYKDAYACIMKLFEMIPHDPGTFKNKDGDWCVLSLFNTLF